MEPQEEIAVLKRERDEARRLLCAYISSEYALIFGKSLSLKKVAEARGWDCFKENTDD